MDSAGAYGAPSTWAGHGLTIEVTTDRDRIRLRVAGHLTQASAALLRECLCAQIAAGRRHAGIDLAGVLLVDRPGFAALLEAHRAFRRCRGTLILSSVSPPVRRMITLMRADSELLIDARADLAPVEDPSPPHSPNR